MKIILDTHTFLWWATDADRLTSRVIDACTDTTITILLSVASIWEMQIKIGINKLQLFCPLDKLLATQIANGIEILPITMNHALQTSTLPPIHKDPFDRLIIAQTMVENAVLATCDNNIRGYPITVFW